MPAITLLLLLGLPLAIYLLCFLGCRRPASIRVSRVGRWMIILIAVGSAIAALWPGSPEIDWGITIGCSVVAIMLCPFSNLALLRISENQYRELVETGSKGLMLSCQAHQPRQIILEGRSRTSSIQVICLTRRMLVTILPRAVPRDKITLLLQWLPKVLPGPLPRIRVVLKSKSR